MEERISTVTMSIKETCNAMSYYFSKSVFNDETKVKEVVYNDRDNVFTIKFGREGE